MSTKELFLKLTEFTYPHGTEYNLLHLLPKGVKFDKFGNAFLSIGSSKTMFACHLDTACKDKVKVNHIIGPRFIKTDGTSILGADDKAGMTIMLKMIESGVPGTYYFFIGEEVGCIGSSALAFKGDIEIGDYDRCISFDRRGYDSIITEQLYGECCSIEFATELSLRLNTKNPVFDFKPDPTGIMTDSACFIDLIPECTNISVGYFNEHKLNESQDMIFLDKLASACCNISWEDLPTKRSLYRISKPKSNYDDNVIDSLSASIRVYIDDELWLVKLTNSRLNEEKKLIKEWMEIESFTEIGELSWNGKTLYNKYYNYTEYVGNREDLSNFIPELDNIPVSKIMKIKKEKSFAF
jgi:hypothetical protein